MQKSASGPRGYTLLAGRGFRWRPARVLVRAYREKGVTGSRLLMAQPTNF